MPTPPALSIRIRSTADTDPEGLVENTNLVGTLPADTAPSTEPKIKAVPAADTPSHPVKLIEPIESPEATVALEALVLLNVIPGPAVLESVAHKMFALLLALS
jgi:hypothetical protein